MHLCFPIFYCLLVFQNNRKRWIFGGMLKMQSIQDWSPHLCLLFAPISEPRKKRTNNLSINFYTLTILLNHLTDILLIFGNTALHQHLPTIVSLLLLIQMWMAPGHLFLRPRRRPFLHQPTKQKQFWQQQLHGALILLPSIQLKIWNTITDKQRKLQEKLQFLPAFLLFQSWFAVCPLLAG